MSGKKYFIVLLTALLIVLITAGCNTGPPQSPSLDPVTSPALVNRVIDTQSACDMIQRNRDNPDFIILDVRTREEFNSGHIAGAMLIDIYSPDFKTEVSELDRDKKYLVYCRTARRSADAAKIMQEMGFREVYDMAGGIVRWTASGCPTVTD